MAAVYNQRVAVNLAAETLPHTPSLEDILLEISVCLAATRVSRGSRDVCRVARRIDRFAAGRLCGRRGPRRSSAPDATDVDWSATDCGGLRQ